VTASIFPSFLNREHSEGGKRKGRKKKRGKKGGVTSFLLTVSGNKACKRKKGGKPGRERSLISSSNLCELIEGRGRGERGGEAIRRCSWHHQIALATAKFGQPEGKKKRKKGEALHLILSAAIIFSEVVYREKRGEERKKKKKKSGSARRRPRQS